MSRAALARDPNHTWTRALIEGNGFAMAQIETGYMNGPKAMAFLYEGRARPA